MKGMLVIILAILPILGHSLDFSVQYYIPTLLGIAAGPAAPLSRFEDHESDSRFLIPVEVKVLALRFGAFALSGNAIISPYIEDGSFSSLNISAGASLYLNRRQMSPIRGWYISLYPIYELPLLTDRKRPWITWRTAFDLGYSVNIGPLCLSAFSRAIVFWHGPVVSILPDWGLTAGIHLH